MPDASSEKPPESHQLTCQRIGESRFVSRCSCRPTRLFVAPDPTTAVGLALMALHGVRSEAGYVFDFRPPGPKETS
jgi:hypothetical protein